MNYSKQDLINYRIKRAKESIEEAKLLLSNKHLNACINRLYYACFYIVIALHLKYNVSAKSHSGVKSMFSSHFIKTEKISKEYGKLYSLLFDQRQKGDYDDYVTFEAEKVKSLIKQASDFIEHIETLLC